MRLGAGGACPVGAGARLADAPCRVRRIDEEIQCSTRITGVVPRRVVRWSLDNPTSGAFLTRTGKEFDTTCRGVRDAARGL